MNEQEQYEEWKRNLKKTVRTALERYTNFGDFSAVTNDSIKFAYLKKAGNELESFDNFEEWFESLDDDDARKVAYLTALHHGNMFNIENVPEAIKQLFPKWIASYPLKEEDMLMKLNEGETFLTKMLEPDFAEKLEGCFFKLSSRSAKDCGIIRATSIKKVAWAFVDSMRFADDFVEACTNFGGTNLNFFEWLDDCKTTKEVRCFIEKGVLKGITKYQWDKDAEYSDKFIENVQRVIEEKILPHTKTWLDTFAVDFFEREDGSVQLIELNNYNNSDPVLYINHDNIGKPFIIEENIYNKKSTAFF